MEIGESVTAVAHPNIAFIKYWGVADAGLRLPANSSISMNLGDAETRTTVRFLPDAAPGTPDRLVLNGREVTGPERDRVTAHLDRIRARAGLTCSAEVMSNNNFPAAAGIASSASAFAALTLAGCAAAGLELSERELSILARLGSGSACRSIPGGFVEWLAGPTSEASYAYSLAPANHWDLRDLVILVSQQVKPVSSTAGHQAAPTSPFFRARLEALPARLEQVRRAIQARDFAALAEATEADAIAMHAVMMTSRPPIYYWQPDTMRLIQATLRWRAAGLPVCFTIDAGPNVHLITLPEAEDRLLASIREEVGPVTVLPNRPGGPARRTA